LNKLPIISAAIFGVILIICLITLYLSNETFMGSFFPEVFGFALDGLILFSGITLVQLVISKKEEASIKETLKDSLRAIAGNYIACCHLVAHQHGQRTESGDMFNYDHKTIEDLREKIGDIKPRDDAESVIELVDYVKFHKSSLEAALSVASQIGPHATHCWFAFLTHINIINSSHSNYGPAISNSLETLKWLNNKNV